MKEDTKTKILSGLNISLGVIVCFIMIKIVLLGSNGFIILLNTPAEIWTLKHSFIGISLLFLTTIIAYLGFTIGLGSINVGIKRLKALIAKKDLHKLLEELKERYKVKEDEN